MSNIKNVVTIGDGNGIQAVLAALRKYSPSPLRLSAVVSLADGGNSVLQALIALAKPDSILTRLFEYRFETGKLRGQNCGDIMLAAMEKVSGGLTSAVADTARLLDIQGEVIPATVDGNVRARTNPRARAAVRSADLIIIGPGDFHAGVASNLSVKGLAKEVRQSRATKIYISGLLAKPGDANGSRSEDFARKIQEYLYPRGVDFMIFNKARPARSVLRKYQEDGLELVLPPPAGFSAGNRPLTVLADLLEPGDVIRHDPDKLGRLITSLL